MKRIVACLCLVILVITLAGFKYAAEEQNNPAGLVGKWSREGGLKLIWEIRNNNTYKIGSQGGEISIEGKYIVDGNKLTVFDVLGGGAAQPCDADVAGQYTYTIADETLTLTKVNDECNGRSANLPGVFKREK